MLELLFPLLIHLQGFYRPITVPVISGSPFRVYVRQFPYFLTGTFSHKRPVVRQFIKTAPDSGSGFIFNHYVVVRIFMVYDIFSLQWNAFNPDTFYFRVIEPCYRRFYRLDNLLRGILYSHEKDGDCSTFPCR